MIEINSEYRAYGLISLKKRWKGAIYVTSIYLVIYAAVEAIFLAIDKNLSVAADILLLPLTWGIYSTFWENWENLDDYTFRPATLFRGFRNYWSIL